MTDATYHVPVVLVPVVPVLSLIVFLEMTLPLVLGAAFLGAAFLAVLFLAAGMLTAVRRGRMPWQVAIKSPACPQRLYRRLLLCLLGPGQRRPHRMRGTAFDLKQKFPLLNHNFKMFKFNRKIYVFMDSISQIFKPFFLTPLFCSMGREVQWTTCGYSRLHY